MVEQKRDFIVFSPLCGAHRSYEFVYNPFQISNNLLHLQELVKICFKSLNQTKKDLGKGGHFWKDFKEKLDVWYINRKLFSSLYYNIAEVI